jgi:hypothetical protein
VEEAKNKELDKEKHKPDEENTGMSAVFGFMVLLLTFDDRKRQLGLALVTNQKDLQTCCKPHFSMASQRIAYLLCRKCLDAMFSHHQRQVGL